jgi:hypothetical protein
MTAERNIATLVAETGFSTTTVRKWWLHGEVRRRTHEALAAAAKTLKIRRPRS